MKLKKVLVAMLLCAMVVPMSVNFTACETDEDSKTSGVQSSQIQNSSSDLGAQNSITPTSPTTPMGKEVTADQWTQIFSTLSDVNNVKLTSILQIEQMYNGEQSSTTETRDFQVAANRVYQKQVRGNVEQEAYAIKTSEGEYWYFKTSGGEWEKEEATDSELNYNLSDMEGVSGWCQDLLGVYAQLVYDETAGVYFGENVYLEEQGISLTSIEVKFENGKLQSLKIVLTQTEPSMGLVHTQRLNYTFTNYGTTQITLPDEQIG